MSIEERSLVGLAVLRQAWGAGANPAEVAEAMDAAMEIYSKNYEDHREDHHA